MRWYWLIALLTCASAHAEYGGRINFTPAPAVMDCGVKAASSSMSKPVVAHAGAVRKRKAKPRPVGVKRTVAVRRAKPINKPLLVQGSAFTSQLCVTPIADKVKLWTAAEDPPMPKEQWKTAYVSWPTAAATGVVPEPPTLWLLLPGLLALGVYRRLGK